MSFFKQQVPFYILVFTAIVMIVAFFIDIPGLGGVATELSRIGVPVTAFALLLGGISLFRRHVVVVSKQERNWEFSVVLLLSFAWYFGVNVIPGMEVIARESFSRVVGKLNEGMFAIVVPFMASMAYRAFKIKDANSAFFTISAVIVLIGNAPIGDSLSPLLPMARDWLLNIPNTGAMRAVNIGIAFGIFAYGLRVMLGYERLALGEIMEKLKGGSQ